MTRHAALVVLLLGTASAAAEEHVVGQKDRQFRFGEAKLETLRIRPGDSLSFRNDDRFAHNVMSRTPGQAFDLGMLRPGERGQRRFVTPGMIEIECALHPQMKFRVEIARQSLD
jgi:plastocyanin